MLILGLALLLIGWLTGIGILWIIGVVLVIIGLVLLVLSFSGAGGSAWYHRRYY